MLGGRSSVTRNAHVAALMDTGFEVENRRAAGERIQMAQTFFEARGFGIGGPDTGGPVAYAALNGAPTTTEREEGQGSSSLTWTAPLPQPASQPAVTPPSTPVGYGPAAPMRRAEVAPAVPHPEPATRPAT